MNILIIEKESINPHPEQTNGQKIILNSINPIIPPTPNQLHYVQIGTPKKHLFQFFMFKFTLLLLILSSFYYMLCIG